MRLAAAAILSMFLFGCATERSFKLVDAKDAQRAGWAEPKTTFLPTESFLAHIRGYGGRKVTLELWKQPDRLLAKATHNIPARKMYRSYDGLTFDTQYRDVELAEQETVYWTSTDYVLRFKPLPPGAYEFRLHSDGGQTQSVEFTVADSK